jgi:hypothetical protein
MHVEYVHGEIIAPGRQANAQSGASSTCPLGAFSDMFQGERRDENRSNGPEATWGMRTCTRPQEQRDRVDRLGHVDGYIHLDTINK